MAAMRIDFLDAHERHLDDADHLRNGARYANADHLYGVAAECGMKHLMAGFGMKVTNGDVPVADRKHADELWARYESYRSGHRLGARYVLASSNPFHDWSIHQRYAPRTSFDRSIVAPHAAAAHRVHVLVKQAKLDGIA